MRQDPLLALDAHYAAQQRSPSEAFNTRVAGELDTEMEEFDFVPVVTGLRRVLPLAAALVFGVLTPGVSRDEVQNLVTSIEQAQASSVPTELETPWKD